MYHCSPTTRDGCIRRRQLIVKRKTWDLFGEMGLKPTELPYFAQLQRNRHIFWWVFAVWLVVVCGGGGYCVYHLVPRLGPKIDPPLSGTGQFAVLGFAVALSAYLRQLRASALELRDKIRGNEVWNYPPAEPQGRVKMKALDDIADKLAFFGPFLIWLFLPTSGRILIGFALRFTQWDSQRVLFSLDIVISLWLFLAFVGLAIAHYESRTYHDEIRAAVRAREEELRPLPAKAAKQSSGS
jgi:hypothetical protein